MLRLCATWRVRFANCAPVFRSPRRPSSSLVPALTYPIGVSDYKKIREDQYFHWDRSLFVKEFYQDAGEAVLILRPRRWAKTTTVSMAKYFFDITQPQLANELFENTTLSLEDPSFCEQYSGAFPVISVSFGECRANTWEKMEQWLCKLISRVYNDHIYLYEDNGFLKEHERLEFGRILKRDPTAFYESALNDLTALLHRYHNKRVIVLIDEYDKPVNEAYRHDYFDDAISFLTSAYTGVLKDNVHLEKGLLTGVLRVAKAGYLSDLNNLEVYSLLDASFADKYGVLEEEVVSALEQEGMGDQLEAVRNYYDGYDTAIPDLRLYNPWSLLNFLKHKQLASYWTETGRYDLIAEAMWAGPMEMREKLVLLLDGKSCEVPLETDTKFSNLKSAKALWSILYFSGYLTGTKSNSFLVARVPNMEVTRELSVMWERVFESKNVSEEYSLLVSAILTGNTPAFATNFNRIAEVFSFHDAARYPEAFYHGFMLSLLFPQHSSGYQLTSNREHGLGRADIVLQPVPPGGKPAVIIELKAKSGVSSLERVAAEAHQQIMEKHYYRNLLPGTTRAILWGIAFSGKEVSVKSTSIPLGAVGEE